MILLKQMLIGFAYPLMKLATATRVRNKITAKCYENMDVAHAHEHWSEVKQSIDASIFLDVRTPEEYAKAHITGAILIPLWVLVSRLPKVPKNRCVYVYCHSGCRSANASALLTMAGYTNVVNILGGIEAWLNAGYPVFTELSAINVLE